ncbi:hypothetical protein DFH09DRAFT_1081211 [Mycena vulgaris]|nr:hypothetical protein DFH09DRAFT_1081211 [Mycena vulgaris]
MPTDDSCHNPVLATDRGGAPLSLPCPLPHPRIPKRPLVHSVERPSPDATDPPVSAATVHLPKYTLVSSPASRMSQVQFLNRDTYGVQGPVNRLMRGGTSYQFVNDAAADNRDRYLDSQALECRPLAVSAAQSEYMGRSWDKHERESLNFLALNGSINGFNTERMEPYSFVGHFKIEVFVPPSSADQPWALETPCPTRAQLRETLSHYRAPQRPFYAFPINSTSLHPILDYLQPQPSHPPGIDPLIQPASLSPELPNHPRMQCSIPPLEADAYELSSITENLPIINASWEYMGNSDDGVSRWRELLPANRCSSRYPPAFKPEPLLFEGELPDVPDDTMDDDKIPRSNESSAVDITPAVTVVQIPDPTDRFSRPIARYVVPARHEEELERIGRVAADLARTIRQDQRAPRRQPPQYASRTRDAAPLPPVPDLSMNFSDSSDEFESDEEEEGSMSNVNAYVAPPRPLETDDSYFPSPGWQLRRHTSPSIQCPGIQPLIMSESESYDSLPDLVSWSSESVAGTSPAISISSSSTDSLASSSEEDIPIFDMDLQYPRVPTPHPVMLFRTPPSRTLSLTPPLASPTALQNLPGTTPLPAMTTRHPSLGHFAHAALATAEKALHGFKLTMSAPSTDTFRELRERIRDLEQASSASGVSRDPSTLFPIDEEKEAEVEASDRLAHLLAETLREPQVFRAEMDVPGVNPRLLLNQKPNPERHTKELFALSSPVLLKQLEQPSTPTTPYSSPTLSMTDSTFFTATNLGLSHQEYPTEVEESELGALSEEDQRMIEEVFNFSSSDEELDNNMRAAGEPSQTHLRVRMVNRHYSEPYRTFGLRPPSRRAARDSPAVGEDVFAPPSEPAEDMFTWAADEDENLGFGSRPQPTSDTPGQGAPPSRRPVRNECGIVTYNRRQFGCPDFHDRTLRWLRLDRERCEAIGYALEFPDRFAVFSRSKLGKLLFPNLQQQRFRHTDRHMRLESVHRARRFQLIPHSDEELPEDIYPDARRHQRISRPGNQHLPEFIVDDFDDDDSDTDSEVSLPEECGIEGENTTGFLRFYEQLQQEHDRRTPLALVARNSRYFPVSPDAAIVTAGFLLADDLPPPKRRCLENGSLGRRVLCAEALHHTAMAWRLNIPHLRSMRGDIAFVIQRLIEVIEWLGLRDEFRHIFFPFDESFPVTTVFQMYSMERSYNPDGFFRRNDYHLNSLLHDAECNFLQSCATLFRRTKDFELAFTLEELLSTCFRDDTGIMQMLREGLIESHMDYEAASTFFNHGYGVLQDRLNEGLNVTKTFIEQRPTDHILLDSSSFIWFPANPLRSHSMTVLTTGFTTRSFTPLTTRDFPLTFPAPLPIPDFSASICAHSSALLGSTVLPPNLDHAYPPCPPRNARKSTCTDTVFFGEVGVQTYG